MKILFSLQNSGFLRNFNSTVALLAQRGHRVHIVTDRMDNVGGTHIVSSLTSTYPSVTFEVVRPPRRGLWVALTNVLRLSIDYWRYLEPKFAQAAQLRGRAKEQVPGLMVALPTLPGLNSTAGRRWLMRVARAAERAIPPRPQVFDLLDREQPDLVLLTPLLYFGSRQVDFVRAARRRGIPTVLGVGSWDHLTTKGLIHEIPDRLVVWNEMQRVEATELHGVDPSHVIVTGAQAYDHWFERRVSTTREQFCGRVGLPADRPYLLYLCSSPFITPHEVPFVRRWIEAIRAADDPRVRSLGLLIRPHPQNAEQWKDVDLSVYPDVSIWPRAGANPVDADARAEYFDSMFHSHAVVGVNTSALIESGIVGRRVYSLVAQEFSGTQEGTLHFQHLKNVEGGLLRLASTLDEHVAQIAPTLGVMAEGDDLKVRGFVQAFVRPHGLDVVATERVVAVIEATAASRPAPVGEPAGAPLARLLLAPLAFVVMLAAFDEKDWQAVRDGVRGRFTRSAPAKSKARKPRDKKASA